MKIHDVKLNVSDIDLLKPDIAIKQFDYGSDAVRVMLYDGADPYDPSVNYDACVFRVIRPDRELDENFLWRKGDEAIGVLPSNEEGVKYIDVPVTLMMSFVAGDVAIELSFIKFEGGEITARKTLARIVISVYSSISSYNVIEKKQIDMLTHILSVAESLKVSCNVDEYVRFIEKAITDELERVNKEALRVEAENLRSQEENGRADAEALRVSAEIVRYQNEADRDANEHAREENDGIRCEAEEKRNKNEVGRVIAEDDRVIAEDDRVIAEEARVETENERVAAENLRIAAELDRQAAEDARIAYIKSLVATKLAELVGSAPESLDTLSELSKALGDDPNFATTVSTLIGQKVDKVEGKGLSANDYTNLEKHKLSNIEDGAEVNVKSDWLCEDASSDAYIKNKPEIPSVEGLASEEYVNEGLKDKVDKTTKINGKAILDDIDLTADDVGALPSDKIVEGFGVPFDVSGTDIVTIDKVHPKEHDVEVKVESINLLNDTDFRTSVTAQGITVDYEGDGIFHIHGTSTGVLTSLLFSFTKEIVPDENYTLYATLLEGTPAKTFYAFLGVYNGSVKRNFINVPLTPTATVGTTYKVTSKPNAVLTDATHISDFWVYVDYASGDTVDCRIQVWFEKGPAKSEPVYVPYGIDCEAVTVCGSYTYPVTDGKAIVKSVSPTMSITTSASGVNVEAKGYQDGLAVIDELKQAIISLGGNI